MGKFELTGIPPARRGTPKVDVTFEMDANGILNVSAKDQGSNKSNKITITNDKARFTQSEIDSMVRTAQEHEEEDKKVKERIETRNGLESFAYNAKNSVDDPDISSKLSSEDAETIRKAAKELLEWLDSNQEASKEEYEDMKDEFEQKLREIMSRRVYNIRKQRYDDLCAVLNMEPQKILYYRDHESGDGYIYLNYYPEKKE